jgi:hypothetical protein
MFPLVIVTHIIPESGVRLAMCKTPQLYYDVHAEPQNPGSAVSPYASLQSVRYGDNGILPHPLTPQKSLWYEV